MKAFRDYIINEIQTRLPSFKTVRMFNNQFERSNNDETKENIEGSFGYPACFIELEEREVKNVALGIKHVDLLVRLHVGLEDYTKKRPNDYITIDDVDLAMQGMRGDSADTVQFSSMIENITAIDTDFNNVNNPILEYTTTYTRLNAYTRKGFTTKAAPTDHNVIANID